MQERAELHKTIWKIANDLRGSIVCHGDMWVTYDVTVPCHINNNSLGEGVKRIIYLR